MSFEAGVAAGTDGLTSDVTTMTEVTSLTASRGGNNGLKVGCACEGGSGDICSGGSETMVTLKLDLILTKMNNFET